MNDTKKPFNFSEEDFEKTLSKEELSGLRKRGFQHLTFKELLRGAPLSIEGKEEQEFVNGLDQYLRHRRHYDYYTFPGRLVADYVFYEEEIEKKDVKYQEMVDGFLKRSLSEWTFEEYSSSLQNLKTTGEPTRYCDFLNKIKPPKEDEKEEKKLLEEFITGGKEKQVFDKEKFSNELYDYITDNDYYEYDIVYDFVNESLKENGVSSCYVGLAGPLSRCNKKADYLKVDTFKNEIGEFSEIEVFDNFLCDNHRREMKDPEFAKSVYDYAKENYKNDFVRFICLREYSDDAYVETYEPKIQEEERER